MGDRINVNRRIAVLTTIFGNTANTFIISIQAVVLIPLYLHAIGSRLYGAWLGSGDVLLWLQAIDLGLPLMIQRIAVAHGSGDMRSVGEYFASGTVVLALVGLCMVLIATGLSFKLPGWMGLHDPEEYNTLRGCFQVGAVAAALNMVTNSAVGLSRGIQKTVFMNVALVLSSLIGFGVSLGLVLTGWGLWSVAIGLVARSVVGLASSVFFVTMTLRRETGLFFRVRWHVLREFLLVSPATALGSLSYAVMNQSQAALVSIFVRPELAAVLTLTRKAAEVARSLVNLIGFSSYGSFAHLVASDQRQRALQVHAEINSLWLSLAVAMASAYMAVNRSLVSIWVGGSQYGGALLTILIAVQLIVVGDSYLMNYLYRAAGPVMRGSVALVVESAIRVPLMIGLLHWLGLPGLPLASIVTAGLSGLLAYRWMLKEVSSFAGPYPSLSPRVWGMRAVLFCIGMLACVFLRWETWTYVLVVGSVIAVAGGMSLIYADPLLSKTRALFTRILGRLRAVSVTERG